MEPEIDNLGLKIKLKSCIDRLRRAEGADSKRKYELERVEEVYGKYSREDKEERSKKTTHVAGTALSQR